MDATPPQQPYSGWAPAEPPPGVPRLASWGRRFAAYLIDNLIVWLGTAAVSAPFFAVGGDVLLGVGIVLVVAGLTIGPALYFTLSHGSERGQTFGKRWLGIRVVDDRNGGPIGYGRAFGRWLVIFALGFLCGLLNILDGLWPLWDRLNQTWHDKIANSVVVKLP